MKRVLTFCVLLTTLLFISSGVYAAGSTENLPDNPPDLPPGDDPANGLEIYLDVFGDPEGGEMGPFDDERLSYLETLDLDSVGSVEELLELLWSLFFSPAP